MMKLYGMSASGNCWKPAVLMKQLAISYGWVEVDIHKGETRTLEFMAKNPNGRVPLLEVAPGKFLAESNAMLCYLAEGTALLPEEKFTRAKVLEWLFFEQYSHEPYVATVRFWVKFMNKRDEWKDKIAEAMKKGYAALGVMETQLVKTNFLAGNTYSIADIALYAYTHVAADGGYDLSKFPNINAWMSRVEKTAAFFPMQKRHA